MRIVRLVLSAPLGTSALVGIQILATDYWLWSAAPTHAYGLMALVALDLALILGVWRVTRLAMIGPLLTATFQFVAMLGYINGREPAGRPPSCFSNFLLAYSVCVTTTITQGLPVANAV